MLLPLLILKASEAAKTLEKEICKECVDLYLEHARFSVSFKEQAPSINGIDKIEFMISMNPGEDMKPLASVASGGELHVCAWHEDHFHQTAGH